MAAFISPVAAVAIMTPILIFIDLLNIWGYRRDWHWRNLMVLLPGAVVGVPCGYLVWGQVSEAAGERLLAGQVKFQPGEWTSGERVWVMDILLPPDLLQAMLATIAAPFEDAATMRLLTLDERGELSVTDPDWFLSARAATGRTEEIGKRP